MDDAETMLEMLDEEYDPAMIPEAEEAVNTVGKAVGGTAADDYAERRKYDHSNAILTFQVDTGGTGKCRDQNDRTDRLVYMCPLVIKAEV